MKWLSDTASRILSTIIVGAVFVAVAYPVTPRARFSTFADSLRPVRPVVIREDGGGLISSYVGFYDALRDSGVPVEVAGECDSACTLVLLLPKAQVCVRHGAVLGFHLARSTLGDTKGDPKYTELMMHRFYPPVVQDWLAKQPPLTLDMTYMPYDTIISLGVFRACE